jgi:serine/threonine protein phosphatase 1
MIKRFGKNTLGRDFAVGDIHGCYTRLQAALDTVSFCQKSDRLFSVGDLVDRGDESDQVLDWLAKPWFHPVRGNHEDYAIRHGRTGRVDLDNYRRNGGGWLLDLPAERQGEFVLALGKLPYVIEVETSNGLVGILHADCPVYDWERLPEALRFRRARERIIWSRDRLESEDRSIIANVHAVIVGHTPLTEVLALGNVIHIDTAGWAQQGHFTVMDINAITRTKSGWVWKQGSSSHGYTTC